MEARITAQPTWVITISNKKKRKKKNAFSGHILG